MSETLGVLAHRGGLVVDRPELSVGVVHAVSRPTGLELELIARRPLDSRSAAERQADIRAGRDARPSAPRRLLPQVDEGTDLRVGWLDRDGRAHWEYGSLSSSSGDHFEGVNGPSLRTVLRFPPMFDNMSIVLAWPEIGFPENGRRFTPAGPLECRAQHGLDLGCAAGCTARTGRTESSCGGVPAHGVGRRGGARRGRARGC
jgi:hypothetical protein